MAKTAFYPLPHFNFLLREVVEFINLLVNFPVGFARRSAFGRKPTGEAAEGFFNFGLKLAPFVGVCRLFYFKSIINSIKPAVFTQ